MVDFKSSKGLVCEGMDDEGSLLDSFGGCESGGGLLRGIL